MVDAKYKAHTPIDDLYQMLAYRTVLGLRRGHLVYVGGSPAPTTHVVRNADKEITCYALDLDRPTQVLLDSVDGLADSIVAARAMAWPWATTSFAATLGTLPTEI